MQKKITILHFQPLEGYPPILNLLAFLSTKQDVTVSCLSTKGNFGYSYYNKPITIVRIGAAGKKLTKFQRVLTYIQYNLTALYWLIKNKPDIVLYYETISGWAACVYKKYLNPKARLFIHYHEYSTPQEYKSGMWLIRHIHNRERKIYDKAYWISNTNQFRLEKFRQDEKLENLPDNIYYIMPNYPPTCWKKSGLPIERGDVFRLVYVGYSLSMDTMYTVELLEWLKKREEIVTLDLYLHVVPKEIERVIHEKQLKNIRLFPSVKYHELPFILPAYDIGLIIYNGAIENYIYNAPNKLFEYLACGLDVWVPDVMIGSLEYVCEDARPRVLALDFTKLDSYPADYLFGDPDFPVRQTDYFCEPEYERLYMHMICEE